MEVLSSTKENLYINCKLSECLSSLFIFTIIYSEWDESIFFYLVFQIFYASYQSSILPQLIYLSYVKSRYTFSPEFISFLYSVDMLPGVSVQLMPD